MTEVKYCEMTKRKRQKSIWYIWIAVYAVASLLCLIFSLDLLDWLGSCSMDSGLEREMCRVDTLSWMGPLAFLIFVVPDIQLCIVKNWNCSSPIVLFVIVFIGCSAGLFYNIRKIIFWSHSKRRIVLNALGIILLWIIGGIVSGMALT